MAALSVLNCPEVTSTTLSGTASRARVIKVYSAGKLHIYATAALEMDFDTTTAEDDDESSTVGWPIPASQGFEFDITNIPAGGFRQVNVWSATASTVVNVCLTQVK